MAYVIGLIFVLALILISIDDLIWDMYYSFRKITGKIKIKNITISEIEATKPKMLAIMIAAYNEENVLYPVIKNLVLSSQYPKSMFHVFLGVYPNDPGTMKVAKQLEDEFVNVHKVIHVLNGPSSKADNLNNIIKNIYTFENKNHLEFAAVIVHDSEDLVHPYEFKLENYLLEKYPAIQMPVFPLQEMPKLSNIFKNMISGSYADEFAENHYRFLVARTATKSFVPSAGTGFAIRRDVLNSFPDSNVFPVGSLTEDYKLSLQLKLMGYDVHYALESISRLRGDGTVAKEFVSTRSMFPSTYKAAVRQKTRWIYGITIQTFKLKDILKNKSLNFASKYSLYRDWKAKIGNILIGPGYFIFTYFVISLFYDLPTIYPKHTFSWYLMFFLSVLMVERQLLRFIAVKNVYGYKSALISSALPPLLPFRMVVGNVINFHATINALLTDSNRRKDKKKDKKKIKWSKTEHEFLEERILKTYRRSLGDTLLYKGLISSSDLDNAIILSKSNNEKLGITLNKLGLVSERDILESICEINQEMYTEIHPGKFVEKYKDKYGKKLLKELEAIPIFDTSKNMGILATLRFDEEKIKEAFDVDSVKFIFTTRDNIYDIINCQKENKLIEKHLKDIENYIEADLITVEQGLIALSYCEKDGLIKDTLNLMGLLKGLSFECSIKVL